MNEQDNVEVRGKILNPIGILIDNGKPIFIDKAPRGLKCGCVCPQCGELYVAKKGDFKQNHFAHYNKNQECEHAYETGLHLIAKEILESFKEFATPHIFVGKLGDYLSHTIPEKILLIDKVYLEKIIEDIRPDIVIEHNGNRILIEIAVTHFIDKTKKEKIKKLDIDTIEINLSKLDRQISLQELKHILVTDISLKKWIYNAELQPYLDEIEKAEEVRRTEALQAAKKRMREKQINEKYVRENLEAEKTREKARREAEETKEREIRDAEVAKRNKIFFERQKTEIKNTKKREDHPIIFLTGKAGTGKTAFLKYIKEKSQNKPHKDLLDRYNSEFTQALKLIDLSGDMIVVAPTGISARNAGGKTIHSLFNIPPVAIFKPGDTRLDSKNSIIKHFGYSPNKQEVFKTMKVLVIDECSMLRPDILDAIAKILRLLRNKQNSYFGGVQVILIGDLYQLPPIPPKNGLLTYKSCWFFHSKIILNAYEKNKITYVEFRKIYRQKDEIFINVLNNIREAKATPRNLEILNSRYRESGQLNGESEYITITSHKKNANDINSVNFAKLPCPSKMYRGEIEGDYKLGENFITPLNLELKMNAQVMITKNHEECYNGMRGVIKKLANDEIIVNCDDRDISITKCEWKNIDYITKNGKIEEKITGIFRQFPLCLAWAITIHKSQGLTFYNAIIDAGNSWDFGQVYVALSRCTNLDGLILKSKITNEIIKTDNRVNKFIQKCKLYCVPGMLVGDVPPVPRISPEKIYEF